MDATQQGVSKRDQDMAALIERRQKETQGPVKEEPKVEEPKEPAEPKEPETKEETPEVEMVQFLGSDGTEYKVPKDATAKLKIDGNEVQAPVSTITQRYQKGAAGDLRLQEAHNTQKRLEEKEAALTQREKAFLAKMAAAKDQKDKGNLSEDDYQAKVKDLATAVVEADEDRIVKGLAEVYKQPTQQQAPVIDESIINQRVEAVVESRLAKEKENRYRKRLTKAVDRFKTDYKDLTEDPKLYGMVNNETARIRKERPGADPWEIIKEAADSVKDWKAKFEKKAMPKKKSTPTPASGRAKIGEDEKPPPTRKDILNEMRKQRGQPPI